MFSQNRFQVTAAIGLISALLGAGQASGSAAPEQAPSPASSLSEAAQVEKWCQDVRKSIKDLGWKLEPCKGLNWKVGGYSVKGRPLLYAEFGDPTSGNTTLVLSMVHGDEVTPLYLGLQLAHWTRDHAAKNPNTHVVIAPMVNPDSFFTKPRTRVNARGVDTNRNFATSDWQSNALALWKKKFKSNPRRFPGSAPRSEPETLFQEGLILQVKPKKILSIHAPLNVMDYDGPNLLTLDRFPKEYVQECTKLQTHLKAKSTGFFPGSLGNYAGRELGIPTITLELPSADHRKARAYWNKFSTGIKTMINFKVPDVSFAQGKPTFTRAEN